jgi:hypothetical protein
MVTPPPAQLEVPLWISGPVAGAVAAELSLPPVADAPADVDTSSFVAPGRTELSGHLDDDRGRVIEWSAAGATHLLCTLTGAATLDALAGLLQPEVAMVAFPRVITETPMPARWPRLRT